jgi:hypothetical protein
MAGPFTYRQSQPCDVEPMLPLLSHGIGSDALTRGDEIESQRDAWIMSARCFSRTREGRLEDGSSCAYDAVLEQIVWQSDPFVFCC